MKKFIKIFVIVLILAIIVFLGYLVKRYLIPVTELEVSSNSEEIIEENEITDTTYKSNDLSIEIKKIEWGEGDEKLTYFIADINLKNPERLDRAFANNQFGTNIVETMSAMVQRNNAILAINGDYYSFRDTGVIIGNSEVYRNNPKREGLAFFKDGAMRLYDEKNETADKLISQDVKFTMSFGPVLVREGRSVCDYKTYAVDDDNIIRNNIAGRNPRTGLGYFDKNHFCFIVVDGRDEGYSRGVTLNEFAKIFEDLGVDFAYNLDGGNSSTMYFMGKRVNKPSQPDNSEREISDMLYIY